MAKTSLPIFRTKRPQQPHPAAVQGIEQRQRNLDRSILRIAKLRPAIFCIGLDRRLVFGQRQLETHVRVHMAIRNMVRDLPDSPSAFTIGRVELLRGQTSYRSAESSRGLPDVVN